MFRFVANSELFHALDTSCASSSWLSKVSSFRQETSQSYYRNDPVKYNLTETFLLQTICIFNHPPNYVLANIKDEHLFKNTWIKQKNININEKLNCIIDTPSLTFTDKSKRILKSGVLEPSTLTHSHFNLPRSG